MINWPILLLIAASIAAGVLVVSIVGMLALAAADIFAALFRQARTG